MTNTQAKQKSGVCPNAVIQPTPIALTEARKMKSSLLLITCLAAAPVSAQEYIYDNLPANSANLEVSFTGKWCEMRKGSTLGNLALQTCGRKDLPASYTYSPATPHGYYNVYVLWVADPKNTAAAYEVRSSDYVVDPETGQITYTYATTTFQVNQAIGGGTWLYVGRYTSIGESGLSLRVTNQNGPVNTDGARFLKIGDYPPPCDQNTGIGCT